MLIIALCFCYTTEPTSEGDRGREREIESENEGKNYELILIKCDVFVYTTAAVHQRMLIESEKKYYISGIDDY